MRNAEAESQKVKIALFRAPASALRIPRSAFIWARAAPLRGCATGCCVAPCGRPASRAGYATTAPPRAHDVRKLPEAAAEGGDPRNGAERTASAEGGDPERDSARGCAIVKNLLVWVNQCRLKDVVFNVD